MGMSSPDHAFFTAALSKCGTLPLLALYEKTVGEELQLIPAAQVVSG